MNNKTSISPSWFKVISGIEDKTLNTITKDAAIDLIQLSKFQGFGELLPETYHRQSSVSLNTLYMRIHIINSYLILDARKSCFHRRMLEFFLIGQCKLCNLLCFFLLHCQTSQNQISWVLCSALMPENACPFCLFQMDSEVFHTECQVFITQNVIKIQQTQEANGV